MAYDRADIGKRIMQIEQGLMTKDKEPSVGEVVDAAVAAGICGRGVAQQVLAELRNGRRTKEVEAPVLASSETFPEGVSNLVIHIDELHYAVDKIKRAVGLAAAAGIEDVKTTFGAIIADQGLALKRAEEDGRIQIEMLEASLAHAQSVAADIAVKLGEADAERADLLARLTEAEEARDTLLARTAILEQDRDRHRDVAEMLRADLEAHRHDLVAARQSESALRDELRMSAAGQIDRVEHLAIVAMHEAQAASLADEKARNADLHARLLRLVGTVVRPDIESAKASAAPGEPS